jgi:RND family efflux transporter MFP subunit
LSSDKGELLHQLKIDRQHREEPAGSGRTWMVVGLLVLVAMVAAGVWFAFSREPPVSVHSSNAQSFASVSANASVLDATGYVTARRQATVSAQITGTLTEVLIEEGDHVKLGQVLGRLDDTAQRAALAQAEAQLHSAEALLVQFQAQLAQSQRDVVRAEDLVGRKLVSQQAVEQARTLSETGSAQVQGQRKQIELSAANVRSAQVQLDYCTVRAPFTGVVIAKAAQVGEIVSPFSAGGGFTRTGIGTIVDMDSLEVEVDVNEAYIGRVQPGQPVDSELNAYSDWKIPSHVIAIIPTADRAKATVKVRIGLDLKDSRIVPDMGVRVSFLEDKKAAPADAPPPAGVLVPTTALRTEGQQNIVFVLADQKARRRAVKLGNAFGSSRQVLAGVSPGEAVIVDAPPGLKDNAAVTVAKP